MAPANVYDEKMGKKDSAVTALNGNSILRRMIGSCSSSMALLNVAKDNLGDLYKNRDHPSFDSYDDEQSKSLASVNALRKRYQSRSASTKSTNSSPTNSNGPANPVEEDKMQPPSERAPLSSNLEMYFSAVGGADMVGKTLETRGGTFDSLDQTTVYGENGEINHANTPYEFDDDMSALTSSVCSTMYGSGMMKDLTSEEAMFLELNPPPSPICDAPARVTQTSTYTGFDSMLDKNSVAFQENNAQSNTPNDIAHQFSPINDSTANRTRSRKTGKEIKSKKSTRRKNISKHSSNDLRLDTLVEQDGYGEI